MDVSVVWAIKFLNNKIETLVTSYIFWDVENTFAACNTLGVNFELLLQLKK